MVSAVPPVQADLQLQLWAEPQPITRRCFQCPCLISMPELTHPHTRLIPAVPDISVLNGLQRSCASWAHGHKYTSDLQVCFLWTCVSRGESQKGTQRQPHCAETLLGPLRVTVLGLNTVGSNESYNWITPETKMARYQQKYTRTADHCSSFYMNSSMQGLLSERLWLQCEMTPFLAEFYSIWRNRC